MHALLAHYGARTAKWDFFFEPEYQSIDESDGLESDSDIGHADEPLAEKQLRWEERTPRPWISRPPVYRHPMVYSMFDDEFSQIASS